LIVFIIRKSNKKSTE